MKFRLIIQSQYPLIITTSKLKQQAIQRMEKNKSIIIRNAVAVKQYAIMEQANTKFRPYMEDTSFIHDTFLENCAKSLLFGVFDGHGGDRASFFLAKNLPTAFKDHYKVYKNNMKTCFQKLFAQMDEKLMSIIPKTQQVGSTGTIGIILLEEAKRVLYVAHVGDSTAYIFDDNGGEKLTPQHRPTNSKQETKVKQNGGKIVNNRLGGVLAVTRAFGDFALKTVGLTSEPQIKKVQLRLSHKYLVVGSDGLWDYVDPKQIHSILKQEIEAPDSCKALIKIAIQKGSTDNITVMVMKL